MPRLYIIILIILYFFYLDFYFFAINIFFFTAIPHCHLNRNGCFFYLADKFFIRQNPAGDFAISRPGYFDAILNRQAVFFPASIDGSH